MCLHSASLAGMALAVLACSSLAAQSDVANAAVNVIGAPEILLVNTAGLEFGAHPSGLVVTSTSIPTAAAWEVTVNENNSYIFSWTLPTSLTSPTGASVSITFGSTSASAPAPLFTSWNPAQVVGFGLFAGQTQDFLLGAPHSGAASDDVVVDLAGATAGVYTGVVTLTVAAP